MASLRHKGIEIIARGIITDGERILLNAPNQNPVPYYYLPGGHVEYGETAEACLRRECFEETGETISSARYITTIENFFTDQNGEHHEINLIFVATLNGKKLSEVISKEAHIIFQALEIKQLHAVRFVPSRIAEFVLDFLANDAHRQ
jgi:ADP-ribose pyrophosphatase YjhB (NUDIX family)